jgi:hypothetical protein
LLKPPSAANAGQEHAIKKENAIVMVMPAPAVPDRRQLRQINRLLSDFAAIDIIIWASDYRFGTTTFSFLTETFWAKAADDIASTSNRPSSFFINGHIAFSMSGKSHSLLK